jgi:DNA primase
MIPQEIVDRVLEGADIVQVVKKHVDLKQKGQNHHGLCPFHKEKTPSFVVSPAKGIYKCFGCGEGGGAVNFLMKKENLTFVEAVKALAKDQGITVPEKEMSPEQKQEYDLKDKIYQANNFALEYYKMEYANSQEAKAYLTARFPSNPVINMFVCVGWASGTLQEAAKKAGISHDVLLAAGLIKKNKHGKLYDSFINRLVWPIYTHTGRVAGFTGRIIEKDSKYPKYLNTSDTPVFKKDRLLFGLFESTKTILQSTEITLVEGTTDVQRMQLDGWNNVVAPLGTSFTDEHAKMVKRLAKRALIITDGDDAGEKSAIRTGKTLLTYGLYVSVVRLPEGQDPDSFWSKPEHNANEYVNNLKEDYVLWMTARFFKNVGIDTGKKIEAQENLCELLACITNDTTRETYLDEVVRLLKPHKITKGQLKGVLRNMVKTVEEEENAIEDGQSLPSYLNEQDRKDYIRYGFYEGKKGNDLNQYFFGPGKRASNFVINPIFHITDAQQPRKLFELVNKYGFSRKIDIDMQEMTSLMSFRKVVEGQGNFIFEGNEAQFMKIRGKLYDNTVFCDGVDTLGWQKQGFWAWANGIQDESKFEQVDENGVVEHKENNYYIPAFSQIYINDKTLYFDERKFKLIDAKISLQAWSELFTIVFKENGRIGIAFWVASAFRDHILTIFKNFPMLNLFGPKGTGKSQMAMSMSCLYGEQQTAFNIHNGTKAGLADHLSRFRNAIAWIDEYKNSLEFDKIETLKAIYDSIGRSRMNMDKGKRKETTEVNSAAIISGQEMPTADIALFSRLIFVRFVQSEFSQEEKENYQRLKEIERNGLSAYTNQLIQHRSYFEKEYYYTYNEVLTDFQKDLGEEVIEDRVLRNWVSIVSAWKCINHKIPFSFSYDELKDTCLNALVYQNKQTSKSDEIGLFWQLLESMYDQNIVREGWDFKIELVDKIVGKQRTLTLNPAVDVLKFKFNTVAKYYSEHSRRMGIKPLPTDTLRYYLENNKHFLLVSKKERFSYVEYNKEEGRNITHKSDTTAYCFRYEPLDVSLKRDLEIMGHDQVPEEVKNPQAMEEVNEKLPF